MHAQFVIWNFLTKSIVDAKSLLTHLSSRGNYIRGKDEGYKKQIRKVPRLKMFKQEKSSQRTFYTCLVLTFPFSLLTFSLLFACSCLLSTTSTQSLDLPAWYSCTIGKLLQVERMGFHLAVQADWRNLSYPPLSRGAGNRRRDFSVVFSAICLFSETTENVCLRRFRKLLWNCKPVFVL